MTHGREEGMSVTVDRLSRRPLSMGWRIFLGSILAAAVPHVAFAEVMDKELSSNALIALSFVGCVSALAWAFRWWTGLIAALVACGCLVLLASNLAEVLDPHVGPAIRAEAGTWHVVLSYAAPVLVVTCHILGGAYQALRSPSTREDPSTNG